MNLVRTFVICIEPHTWHTECMMTWTYLPGPHMSLNLPSLSFPFLSFPTTQIELPTMEHARLTVVALRGTSVAAMPGGGEGADGSREWCEEQRVHTEGTTVVAPGRERDNNDDAWAWEERTAVAVRLGSGRVGGGNNCDSPAQVDQTTVSTSERDGDNCRGVVAWLRSTSALHGQLARAKSRREIECHPPAGASRAMGERKKEDKRKEEEEG